MPTPKIWSRSLLLGSVFLLASSVYAEKTAKPTLAPGSVQVKITPEMAKTAIKTVFGQWTKSADMDQLKKELKTIKKTGKEPKDDLGLRGLRKPAKALRSMMSWLDAKHDGEGVKELPFAKFVTKLGHLDDAITAGVVIEVKKEAGGALKALKKSDVSEDLTKFQPTSNESFQSFMRAQLADVQKLMAKEHMTATEFHSIRKVMRGLYFSVHFSGAESQSPAAAQFAALLDKIGSDMGDVHGEQAIDELKGKIGDLDKVTMKMPKEIGADIQTMIASLAKE
jgi:hypothetical protein